MREQVKMYSTQQTQPHGARKYVLTVVGGRVIHSRVVDLINHPRHFNLGGQNNFSGDLQLLGQARPEVEHSLTKAMQDITINQQQKDLE